MRTQKQILDGYAEACTHTEMRVQKGYTRVHEFANIDRRRALRAEYIETLSDDKRLAIQLILKIKGSSSPDYYYEIDGIEDDWDGYIHKKYLETARKMIKAFLDNGGMLDNAFSILTAVIDCL